MKINLSNYLKDRESIVYWAIIHMMAVRERNIGNIPEWNPECMGGQLDTQNVDVTLTINGVEVNFVEMVEAINKQNDYMVAQQAQTLLNDKFSDVFNQVDNLKETLDTIIERERDKCLAQIGII